MIISDSFKEIIKSTFYDKEITLCTIEIVTENDGQARKIATESETTFLGNVRFDDLERIQEDYGIKEQIDVIITTDETIVSGVICKYNDRFFEIVKVIPFDSHNLLAGKQWLLESGTLISA